MEKIITTKSFNKKRDIFVQKNEIIESIWISNKKNIKEIIEISKQGNVIETYLTLCPFYDFKKTWWIKGDYKNFKDINWRYKDKFSASMSILDFLKEQNINIKVNFLLADNGIIVNDKYDKKRFNDDILWITDLYKSEISKSLDDYNFINFSDFWINWEKLNDISQIKTTNETIEILNNFWINIEKFKFSLEIIEKSFWITGAYYLIKSYLEENKQLNELLEKSIFINTEATWPLNSLYTAGDKKLDKNNLLVRVKI